MTSKPDHVQSDAHDINEEKLWAEAPWQNEGILDNCPW
jgi:hypothetical protein